jgi:hypothetical protein
MKTCIKCKKILQSSDFYKDISQRDGLHTKCKKCQNVDGKKWYQDNKEREAKRAKEYRKMNKELITERRVERRKKLKEKVFEEYGGSICRCCGEDNLYFLTIDHINNDGAEERRKLFGKSTTGLNFYEWLTKNNFPNPEKYQVLCMNCNFGKARNNGICPHKEKK